MKSVYLSDENMLYEEAKKKFANADYWATSSCLTYKGYTVVDVSDCSNYCDQIAAYKFGDEKDAMWFKLKWA